MMSAKDVYPNKDGISLYNRQGKPAHPIMPVSIIPAIQQNRRYFHFGTSKADGCLAYTSANFMPKQNSHRYCKKKLFQTRSSLYPKNPTSVDHNRLMANAIQHPPFNVY